LKGKLGSVINPGETDIDDGAVTDDPFLSIMITEINEMPPFPVLDAKEIVAIGPLPLKAAVLIIATFIKPGYEEFEASIAPETSPPFVTDGEFSVAAS